MHAAIGLTPLDAAPDSAPHLVLVEKLDLEAGQMLLRVLRVERQDVREFTTGGGGGAALTTEVVVGPPRSTRHLTLGECRFQDADGKAIAAADLPGRLEDDKR